MSKISTKPFTCPKCGYKGKIKMYDSVNVTLDAKLREMVLSGEIFDWTCPKCGEALSVRHNLIYHDMDRRVQIYYSPTECEEINKMIHDMLSKYPGMRNISRTVDSLNALREKIFIFEEGLNDIAIEFSKVLMKYDKNNSIPQDCELRFEKLISIDNDSTKGQLVFRQIIENQPKNGMILYDKGNYDNFLNEIQTNEKFKMTFYCETINEKWILDRIV